MLTCRDLTKCAVGQGKYVLITAEDGGIVNDPVLLRVEADRWWLALADSDAGLWARGVAINSGPRRDGRASRRSIPIQVQGPKSKDVMRTLFGDAVLDIKYYWTMTTELDGIPVVISRTGWTGEVGYEIYLRDASRGGDLWDRVMEAGRPHDIRPIAPVRGAPHRGRHLQLRLRHDHRATTRSRSWAWSAWSRPRTPTTSARPPSRRSASAASAASSSASRSTGDALSFEIAEKRPALHDGQPVGTLTDLIWSPRLERNIGYVWVPIELAAPGTPLEIAGPRRRPLGGPDGGHPLPRRQEGHPARLRRRLRRSPRPPSGSTSASAGRAWLRVCPKRQAMRMATQVTATMIVEMALISGVTPNLMRDVQVEGQRRRAGSGVEGRHDQVIEREGEGEHGAGRDGRQPGAAASRTRRRPWPMRRGLAPLPAHAGPCSRARARTTTATYETQNVMCAIEIWASEPLAEKSCEKKSSRLMPRMISGATIGSRMSVSDRPPT